MMQGPTLIITAEGQCHTHLVPKDAPDACLRRSYSRGVGNMKSKGEQVNAKRGDGEKVKPSKMHASERCTQACGTHAEQAGMQEGRERKRRKERKRG